MRYVEEQKVIPSEVMMCRSGFVNKKIMKKLISKNARYMPIPNSKATMWLNGPAVQRPSSTMHMMIIGHMLRMSGPEANSRFHSLVG